MCGRSAVRRSKAVRSARCVTWFGSNAACGRCACAGDATATPSWSAAVANDTIVTSQERCEARCRSRRWCDAGHGAAAWAVSATVGCVRDDRRAARARRRRQWFAAALDVSSTRDATPRRRRSTASSARKSLRILSKKGLATVLATPVFRCAWTARAHASRRTTRASADVARVTRSRRSVAARADKVLKKSPFRIPRTTPRPCVTHAASPRARRSPRQSPSRVCHRWKIFVSGC